MLKYTYRLIRYIHDPAREEAINIGLLFYVSELGIIKFAVRENLSSLKSIFPDLNVPSLRKCIKTIESNFNDASLKSLDSQLPLEALTINDISKRVFPSDASSLVWGNISSGITADIETFFDYLNQRYVQQSVPQKNRVRHDSDVWRNLSRELKQRNLLNFFTPTTIDIGGFPEKIDFSYQNGKLHCLKPLSFDLTEEGIYAKALKERGKTAVRHDRNQDGSLVFYYLIGKPSDPNLQDDFKKVESILKESGEVFIEDKVADLASYLQTHINFH